MIEVKERILQKAHELYHRFGIRSVSMDEIATGLGISKKTVYQCYADKEELVREVFSRIMEGNCQQCQVDQERAENAVHEMFLASDMMQELFAQMNPSVMYEMEKYHPTVYKKFQEFRWGFIYKAIRTNLERGVSEELYRPEIDTDLMARYRLESIFLPFNSEAFPNNRTHLLSIQQGILEHFLYGLATSKGRRLIEKYKQQRTKQ